MATMCTTTLTEADLHVLNKLIAVFIKSSEFTTVALAMTQSFPNSKAVQVAHHLFVFFFLSSVSLAL